MQTRWKASFRGIGAPTQPGWPMTAPTLSTNCQGSVRPQAFPLAPTTETHDTSQRERASEDRGAAAALVRIDRSPRTRHGRWELGPARSTSTAQRNIRSTFSSIFPCSLGVRDLSDIRWRPSPNESHRPISSALRFHWLAGWRAAPWGPSLGLGPFRGSSPPVLSSPVHPPEGPRGTAELMMPRLIDWVT